MGFDAYSAVETTKETKVVDKDLYNKLNKYVVDTCQLQQPETLQGVISMIVDLGTQKLQDAQYKLDTEDKDLSIEELNEKYADELVSGKVSKFDKAYDNDSKSWLIHKFVPEKDRQSIVYAVDFPEIMLDKGQFFGGESNPKPLRLWFGGQYYQKSQGKMLVQNVIPLKVTKADNVNGWTMNPKSSLYKMAVAAKVIKQNDQFLPQDIDKLLGKTLQFKAQVFFKKGNDGKEYYTEKVSFAAGLARGQSEREIENTYLVQFNKPNNPEALKELRKHIINTIENATNFEGSVIQKELLEVRPQTFAKSENTKVVETKGSVESDDDLW